MTARTLTIALYATAAVFGVLLYAAGRGGRVGLVPLADVVDALRHGRVARLGLVLGWAWLGWHFLAR